MTRSKDVGTKGETGLVNCARTVGYPDARRIVLHGGRDQGDVELAKGLIAEVKAGHAAEQASYNQIFAWLDELDVEIQNYAADHPNIYNHGILVVKRKGASYNNVGEWWGIERRFVPAVPGPGVPCWMRVKDLLKDLREDYGDAESA